MAAADRPERWLLAETAIGGIGLAFTADGLTRLQLPERDRGATEAHLIRRGGAACDTAAPAFIDRLVSQLAAYARGERVDFMAVPLDLSGARPFDLPVWEAAWALTWGEVVTYGELTRRLGPPYVATAVGQALGRNPVPLVIPCHRVVAAGGRIGGFSAPGGAATKSRLLALEGVAVDPEPSASRPPEVPPLLALMRGS